MLEQSKKPDWSGKTAVIFASGPSLTKTQVDAVHHRAIENEIEVQGHTGRVRTIAVNSTAEIAPWASVFYACDFLWWKVNYGKFWGDQPRRCWTQDRASAERFHINFVRQASAPGLGKKVLHTNGNSGAGAINLAYLFGARRILLLGFDMKLGPKGEKHHHPDHPHPLVQGMQFNEWIHKMGIVARDLKAEGVEVVNCTPGSALQCFPFGDIATELAK